MQTFADVHRWADIKIRNYVAAPRENFKAVPSHPATVTLLDDEAFWLPANNAEARIAFAEIVLQHLLGSDDLRDQPICFVTFAPVKCAFEVGDGPFRSREYGTAFRPIRRAACFDIQTIQQMARQAMGDVPFVGMVEAALYHRWGPRGRSLSDWISWHCHLLAWGANRVELSRHLAPLRARHRSLREEVPSVHVQEVPLDDVERQSLYMLKAPQKLYRVEYFKRPWKSPITGERKPPGWHTQKDWLQTGDRVRLLDIIGERTLDKLLFGNREGTELVNAIRSEALAPFHAWEEERRRLHRR